MNNCDAIRYLDQNGTMYFLELLNRAISNKVVEEVFNQAIPDEKFKKRIQLLADENLIITQDELTDMLAEVGKETDDKLKNLKNNIEANLPSKITAVAMDVFENGIEEKLSEGLDKSINIDNIASKVANKISNNYVKKNGDTMTGALTATEVAAGKFITSSGIIFY